MSGISHLYICLLLIPVVSHVFSPKHARHDRRGKPRCDGKASMYVSQVTLSPEGRGGLYGGRGGLEAWHDLPTPDT